MTRTLGTLTLDPREAAAIDYLRRSEGMAVGYSTLATPLDITVEGARGVISRLKDEGYVRVRSSQGVPAEIELTKKGALVAADIAGTHPTVGGWDDSVDVPEPVDVHAVTVRCPIRNRERLERTPGDHGWRAKWTTQDDLSWAWASSHDSYSAAIPVLDRSVVMVFREEVRLVLKRPATAYTVRAALEELYERIERAVEWVNQHTPMRINLRNMEIETTHAAAVNHHLAQLADGLDGVELTDIEVIDREDGTERVRGEASRAWPEIEFDGAGTAPVDLDRTINEWLDAFVHNGESVRALAEVLEDEGRVRALKEVADAVRDGEKVVENPARERDGTGKEESEAETDEWRYEEWNSLDDV